MNDGDRPPERQRAAPPANATPFWPADNAAVMAHVTLLQGIINRLAANSASCKTWCIALVTALVSLTGATKTAELLAIVLLPVAILGFLDASYLAQERAYRGLYKRMIDLVHAGTYELQDTFTAGAPLQPGARKDAFLSWSVAPMYLAVILLAVVAYCLM